MSPSVAAGLAITVLTLAVLCAPVGAERRIAAMVKYRRVDVVSRPDGTTGIYWCPFSRYYFRKPCGPLNTHTDIRVDDLLTIDDIASHEMGGDLYEEWWTAGNRSAPLSWRDQREEG